MELTDSLTPLISVAALWMLAALSPGPNFLLTIRVAITQSRRLGFCAVIGIGLGTLIWALAGFLGIHSLFLAAPWLYLALKSIGGAYLVWMGCKLIHQSLGTKDNSHMPEPSLTTAPQAFRLGLVTNLANPKTALFVAGLFAATMPSTAPAAEGAAAITIMVAISLTWYSLVAFLFSSKRVADAYALGRHWIDRLAGACFIFFGIELGRAAV